MSSKVSDLRPKRLSLSTQTNKNTSTIGTRLMWNLNWFFPEFEFSTCFPCAHHSYTEYSSQYQAIPSADVRQSTSVPISWIDLAIIFFWNGLSHPIIFRKKIENEHWCVVYCLLCVSCTSDILSQRFLPSLEFYFYGSNQVEFTSFGS